MSFEVRLDKLCCACLDNVTRPKQKNSVGSGADCNVLGPKILTCGYLHVWSSSADNVNSVATGCLADITTRRQVSRHALSTVDKDGHVADVAMTNHPYPGLITM